eukprot:4881557-Prymnesium_polylepis.1
MLGSFTGSASEPRAVVTLDLNLAYSSRPSCETQRCPLLLSNVAAVVIVEALASYPAPAPASLRALRLGRRRASSS